MRKQRLRKFNVPSAAQKAEGIPAQVWITDVTTAQGYTPTVFESKESLVLGAGGGCHQFSETNLS